MGPSAILLQIGMLPVSTALGKSANLDVAVGLAITPSRSKMAAASACCRSSLRRIASASSACAFSNGAPAPAWNNGPVTVALSGQPGVTYSIVGASPSNITESGLITVTGDGYHQVTVTGGGDSASFEVWIDSTQPVIEIAPPNAGAPVVAYTTQTIQFECLDAGSGIATGGCTATLASLATPAGITVQNGDVLDTSTPGTYTLEVTAIDVVGNGTTSSIVILIVADTLAPVVTGGVEGDPPNDFGWYNRAVTVVWSVDDTDPTVIAPADTPFAIEGLGQVVSSPQVCDQSGNCTTGSVTVNVDFTAPTITVSTSVAANGFGWNNEPVIVTASCVDDWSVDNLGQVEFCSLPVLLTDDGEYEPLSFSGSDYAGNSASNDSRPIKIDTTPPTLTSDVPAAGATVWQGDYVPPTCAASDALSGLDGVCTVEISAPYLVLGGYELTVGVEVSDKAGNSTTISSTFTVQTDGAGPLITPSPSPAPNGAGWWNSSVTYSFSCSDSSGVQTCPAPWTFGAEGENQETTVSATDMVDNVGNLTVSGVNIDLTPPIVDVTAPTTVEPLDEVTILCEATDALSGIAASDCDSTTTFWASTLTEGPNLFSFSATDVAGNPTTVTITITLVVPVGSAPIVQADMGVPGLGEVGFQSKRVVISGSFSDPNGPGPYKVWVRWDAGEDFTRSVHRDRRDDHHDGSDDGPTDDDHLGGSGVDDDGEFIGAHNYRTSGEHTVTVMVCDAGGACGTDDLIVHSSVSDDIVPVLQCVNQQGGGSHSRYQATWGYDNPAMFAIAVDTRRKQENTFTSRPYLRGQPQIFLPGVQRDVFNNTFRSGTQTWQINGNSASATTDSPTCLP